MARGRRRRPGQISEVIEIRNRFQSHEESYQIGNLEEFKSLEVSLREGLRHILIIT